MVEELVITVASKVSKEKGGFDITDTVGGKYLISLKNALIAEGLVVGRASKISVASTSYGKYINSAELFDGQPPEEKQIARVEKPIPAPSTRTQDINDSIEAQTAYKGIIELLVADRVKVNGLVGKWALAWAMSRLGADVKDIKVLADAEAVRKEV